MTNVPWTPQLPTPGQPPVPGPPLPPPVLPTLGPLAGLTGGWSGHGFNTIWQPHDGPSGDHFLQLNLTQDEITFTFNLPSVPNRGLLQPDIAMAGLSYVQTVSDANEANASLHFEPGLWLHVPPTSQPNVPETVVRLASIPHGTTLLAQGFATTTAGAPPIPAASITPFSIGNKLAPQPLPEQNLNSATANRTSGPAAANIDQAMLDDPNSVLRGSAPTNVAETTILTVSSNPTMPIVGGGTENTAFLGSNAATAEVDATLWLYTPMGSTQPTTLQYTQTVILNFNGLSWPHVTVGTLSRTAP